MEGDGGGWRGVEGDTIRLNTSSGQQSVRCEQWTQSCLVNDHRDVIMDIWCGNYSLARVDGVMVGGV